LDFVKNTRHLGSRRQNRDQNVGPVLVADAGLSGGQSHARQWWQRGKGFGRQRRNGMGRLVTDFVVFFAFRAIQVPPGPGADVTGIGRIDKGEDGSYLSRAAAVPVFPSGAPLQANSEDFHAGFQRDRTTIFGSSNERKIRPMQARVAEINALEPRFQAKSDAELKAMTAEFRERLAKDDTLEDLLPEAFAVVREAAKRTFRPAPFRRAARRRHGASLRQHRRDEDR